MHADYQNLERARQEYVAQIATPISLASEHVQIHQEEFRRLAKRNVVADWTRWQLGKSLQLLSRLHAPDPFNFPDQQCDGVALLKTFLNPPEYMIIASWGNIPAKQGKVNFTPKTGILHRLTKSAEAIVFHSNIHSEDDYIHSIKGTPVEYEHPPKSALFVPAYFYKSTLGLLYLHSSQQGWFDNCNNFYFLLLGNKLGRFFLGLPFWLEEYFLTNKDI